MADLTTLSEGDRVTVLGVPAVVDQIITDRKISVRPVSGGPNVTVEFEVPFRIGSRAHVEIPLGVNVSTSHITGNAPQPGDRVPVRTAGDWTGDRLDDGTPVFDCAACGQLSVTTLEECPSVNVPAGAAHSPRTDGAQ